ncbi:polysaccharide pyruvyl transferase family protein [Plantibacter sp. YIM 135347]|uniref:polysaccharide pyruvyl transferase family protein n=1 Tax=Plantibacter sp. YIM 135347 TaxID=3423919 RepID=UPI003D33F349
MTPNRPRRLVYLGWHGFQNFGDDLLHASWQAALDTELSVSAPLTRRDYVEQAPRFVKNRFGMLGSERVVLLGGGTTIGFGNWASHTRLAAKAFAAAGVLVPGAGAAESVDSFALGLQPQDWAAWAEQRDVALFGVRGPLTARECEDGWQPTGVLGDPALIYPALVDCSGSDSEAGTLGVCIGADPASRFDVTVIAEAVRAHVGEHGVTSVKVFALSPGDVAQAASLARAIGDLAVVVAYTGDIEATMHDIASCGLFVSERLHGAVAAVSLGVPTVPLSYASKCDDFWMSVTGGRADITVGHTADELISAMNVALTTERQALVHRNLAQLQRRLLAAAARINAWLDGTMATSALLETRSASIDSDLAVGGPVR